MNKFSHQLYLWALGIMQPANATITKFFMQAALPSASEDITTKIIKMNFKSMLDLGLICMSSGKSSFIYSLTEKGNRALLVKLRRHRDKARLFLLKNAATAARQQKYISERGEELTGVSPVRDFSIAEQSRRPGRSVVGADERSTWSSTFKQLHLSAGPAPRSDFVKQFDLYSFDSCRELAIASNRSSVSRNELDISLLSLCIGVSPSLILSFCNRPENHYRVFELHKQHGGRRVIHSPRVFLKTVQLWIKNYILEFLEINEACHAYRKQRSIQTNAAKHLNKKYVANVDIENYFGSISRDNLKNKLEADFSPLMASCISKLCTVSGILPQGAPTSPILSNYYLLKFDFKIHDICTSLGLSYTRYADDITISGHDKDKINSVIGTVRKVLVEECLRLNEKKTRIASKGGQQNVTGIVVNDVLQPPREFRKTIRAMFHKAKFAPEECIDSLDRLKGYVNYLKSFDVLRCHSSIQQYEGIIKNIQARKMGDLTIETSFGGWLLP